VYLPSPGCTHRTHTTHSNNKTLLNYHKSGGVCCPSSDIRGNIIFLRGSFCPLPRCVSDAACSLSLFASHRAGRTRTHGTGTGRALTRVSPSQPWMTTAPPPLEKSAAPPSPSPPLPRSPARSLFWSSPAPPGHRRAPRASPDSRSEPEGLKPWTLHLDGSREIIVFQN